MVDRASPRRILVVEDDDLVGEFLNDFFTFQGHQVTVCKGANQVRAILMAHEYSLLVADISMPGMTEVELVYGLRAERCQVPMLVLGSMEIELLSSLKALGPTEFLAKPFHTAQLLSAVDRLLTPQ